MNKKDYIIIKGARDNNLKNINVTIPKNKLVVFTGLSGSGKSTLALNTIYNEGQRRYVESLSSYARQFLGSVAKPDVDSIEGLSPAISIEQKSTSNNPRSTVDFCSMGPLLTFMIISGFYSRGLACLIVRPTIFRFYLSPPNKF